METISINKCEIVNQLGDNDYSFILLKAPRRELYYIYVNGDLFGAYDKEIFAVMALDMLYLHYKEYAHLHHD